MSGPKQKYPFREMQVDETRIVAGAPKTFSRYAWKYGEMLGMKFRTRRVGEGVRLRRVA